MNNGPGYWARTKWHYVIWTVEHILWAICKPKYFEFENRVNIEYRTKQNKEIV